MSLYHHLKTSQTLTLEELENKKTSHLSHARVKQKSDFKLSSYIGDAWDGLPSRKTEKTPSRAHVTFGTVQHFDPKMKIVAWINSNPPELPEIQNHCAACGAFIPVYDTGWIYLADGALIHYSGEHGLTCWEEWKKMRSEAARAALYGDG